jgi:hypothetical protein
MVPNQHAGTATSMDIVKKTVPKESEKMCSARVSMDRPIGPNKNNLQLVKEKNIMKLKVQSEKCTQEIWPQSSRVFNEGHSYFPELRPSDIFFNDVDPLFHAFAANKLIFKKIMFLNGEFFRTICNQNSAS